MRAAQTDKTDKTCVGFDHPGPPSDPPNFWSKVGIDGPFFDGCLQLQLRGATYDIQVSKVSTWIEGSIQI